MSIFFTTEVHSAAKKTISYHTTCTIHFSGNICISNLKCQKASPFGHWQGVGLGREVSVWLAGPSGSDG